MTHVFSKIELMRGYRQIRIRMKKEMNGKQVLKLNMVYEWLVKLNAPSTCMRLMIHILLAFLSKFIGVYLHLRLVLLM